MLPVDVVIVGQALTDFGFTAYKTIQGVGLNTFGFLWPCDGIWDVAQDPRTTTWVSSLDTSTVEKCTD